LPFSWGLNVLSWGSRRFRLRVFERKRLPPLSEPGRAKANSCSLVPVRFM
jgi:hypothetical protein